MNGIEQNIAVVTRSFAKTDQFRVPGMLWKAMILLLCALAVTGCKLIGEENNGEGGSSPTTPTATHTLSYSAGANGSITGDKSQTVNEGANGSAVTADPDDGYHFVNWSDAVTTATRTDTNVTANKSVTANFAINATPTYTLTYGAGANGSITGDKSQIVNEGDGGTAVTAVPATGYHFVDWSDNVATATRTDINVSDDVNVMANFAIDVASCSGGPGGANDTVAPSVCAVDPANGATGVDRDASITATFNEDMLGTSMNNGLSLTLNSTAIAGNINFDGASNTVSFTPDQPLVLLGQYTASVDKDVADLSGNKLGAAYTWSFKARDGVWGTAAPVIGHASGSVYRPHIVAAPDGHAIAIWSSDFRVASALYVPGSGWQAATFIDGLTSDVYIGKSLGNPQIAIAPNGKAFAVWIRHDNSSTPAVRDIMASRYVPGSGWQAPTVIDTHIQDASDPQVAVDDAGNAIVVWVQEDDSEKDDIWARYYNHNTGWSAAEVIDSTSARASSPQVEFGGTGSAIAVWRETYVFNGGGYDIRARIFTTSSGWEPSTIVSSNHKVTGEPHLAMNDADNAIVVWQRQLEGAQVELVSNYYSPATGWGTTTELVGNAFTFAAALEYQISVAINDAGNAIAVWRHRGDIWANRFVPGAGWETAETIENSSDGTSSPDVAMDDAGNAIAVWDQGKIFANRYIPGTGWIGNELLTRAGRFSQEADIAIDGAGNAIAVWGQDDDTNEIRDIATNRFE